MNLYLKRCLLIVQFIFKIKHFPIKPFGVPFHMTIGS